MTQKEFERIVSPSRKPNTKFESLERSTQHFLRAASVFANVLLAPPSHEETLKQPPFVESPVRSRFGTLKRFPRFQQILPISKHHNGRDKGHENIPKREIERVAGCRPVPTGRKVRGESQEHFQPLNARRATPLLKKRVVSSTATRHGEVLSCGPQIAPTNV